MFNFLLRPIRVHNDTPHVGIELSICAHLDTHTMAKSHNQRPLSRLKLDGEVFVLLGVASTQISHIEILVKTLTHGFVIIYRRLPNIVGVRVPLL